MSGGIAITDAIAECHDYARAKGFWRNSDYLYSARVGTSWTNIDVIMAKLALVHTEIEEFREALFEENVSGQAEEIADVVIRVFDLAGATKVDIVKPLRVDLMTDAEKPSIASLSKLAPRWVGLRSSGAIGVHTPYSLASLPVEKMVAPWHGVVCAATEAIRKADREAGEAEFSRALARVCAAGFVISESLGFDIENEIRKKMAINRDRPTMHGKLA